MAMKWKDNKGTFFIEFSLSNTNDSDEQEIKNGQVKTIKLFSTCQRL